MHCRWVYLVEACQLSPQFLIYFGKHTSGCGLFWSPGKAFINSILLGYAKLPWACSWPCICTITSSSDLVGATLRCCSMAAGLRFCVNDRQVFVWLLRHLVFGFMMMRDGCKKDNKLEKSAPTLIWPQISAECLEIQQNTSEGGGLCCHACQFEPPPVMPSNMQECSSASWYFSVQTSECGR